MEAHSPQLNSRFDARQDQSCGRSGILVSSCLDRAALSQDVGMAGSPSKWLRCGVLLPLVVLPVDALAIEGRFDLIGVRGWVFVAGSVGLGAIYGAQIDRDQRRGKRQLAKASIGRFFAYAVFFFATAFLLNQWAIIGGIYADGLDSAGGALVSALQSAAMSAPFFLISWVAFYSDRRVEDESQSQSERDRVLRERLLAEMRSAPSYTVSYPFHARNELGKDGGRTDEILKRIATCVRVSDGTYQLKEEFRGHDEHEGCAQAEND